jgi:hypothetical protein
VHFENGGLVLYKEFNQGLAKKRMMCAIGKERYCADGRTRRMESFYIRLVTLRIYMMKTIESVSDEMRSVITARAGFFKPDSGVRSLVLAIQFNSPYRLFILLGHLYNLLMMHYEVDLLFSIIDSTQSQRTINICKDFCDSNSMQRRASD